VRKKKDEEFIENGCENIKRKERKKSMVSGSFYVQKNMKVGHAYSVRQNNKKKTFLFQMQLQYKKHVVSND